MDLSTKIHMVARSDTGLKRSHNEDSVGQLPSNGVVVLADGMGGYKAGEVASAIAVNTLLDSFADISNSIDSSKKLNIDQVGTVMQNCTNAVVKTNEIIFQTAESQPQYRGMGTTVVTSLFVDNKLIYTHVGDSRIYRYRGNELQQLTVDHTLLQELVDRGLYTKEEARHSLNKNLVTKALGVENDVEPSTAESDVETGDLYLFCSDGLHDMMSDSEIGRILYDNAGNLEAAADALIDNANNNGGADNVSVILAKVLRPYPLQSVWYHKITSWF
ncbi:MAG: Stp1/IreP family PP2C-type Ser/Thr phosphatase [Pseudomonadota bacterium]